MFLQLSYLEPYAHPEILRFLGARSIPGVEHISEGTYRRTVRLGATTGWMQVEWAPDGGCDHLKISSSLEQHRDELIVRTRRLFDLDMNPLEVAPVLGDLAEGAPGLRLPGAFDGFEAAVRAVLGQQVSVAFATVLAGRIAAALGLPIETEFSQLTTCFPSAKEIAVCSVDDIARLGVVSQRAKAILGLAVAVASGEIRLEPGPEVAETREKLLKISGIGPWTADYLCMRALHDRDSFPGQDLGVIKALGEKNPKKTAEMVEKYRPWRSYAVMHLWHGYAKAMEDKKKS